MRSDIPTILDTYHAIGGNRAMQMAFSEWSYRTADASATFVIRPEQRRQTRDGITHVRVSVDMTDGGYRVEFLSVSTIWPHGREVSLATGVHAEDLRRTVEMRTGLMLSMGSMGQRMAVAS